MSIIRTIAVDVNDLEFPANWEEGDTVNQQQFTVTIDGKEYGGGFRYEVSESDWFDVVLTDNTFTVTVKENFNINYRNGYITVHHNSIQGDDGEEVINITQKGVECTINVNSESEYYDYDKREISFNSIPSQSDNEDAKKNKIEICKIDVNITGGNRKYFIKSFKEYNNSDKVIKNDNGIKVEKLDDTKLRVTSYGRVFLDVGQYYEIVLAHDNDVTKTCIIKVVYDDVYPRTEVPPLLRSVLSKRLLTTNIERTNIPTFNEKLTSEDTIIIPSLTIYGLNAQIQTKKRGRKSKLSNEIVFESIGGTFEYNMKVVPEKSLVSVKLSSNFITYKISSNVLALTAKPNPYNVERKCIIRIRNIYDPFNTIVKTIIQKGVEK